MKILSAQQQREADAFTVLHEPISSIDLMERAGFSCVDWVLNRFPSPRGVAVFCGMRNNGADGLVIARGLAQAGWDVTIYVVRFVPKESPEFSINRMRLSATSCRVVELKHVVDLPAFTKDALVIDALLGAGASRPVEGFLSEVIGAVNGFPGMRISIDIPSGMFCDQPLKGDDFCIHADYTLTFQSPKLSFFLPEHVNHVGELVVLDIGLHAAFLEKCDAMYGLSSEEFIQHLIRKRKKNSHKGSYGHAVLVGGSVGKIGAIVLSAKAALRAGAGKCTAVIPKEGNGVMQCSVPEVMTIPVSSEKVLAGKIPEFPKEATFGIGPGMGTDPKTALFLEELLRKNASPVVLDADAINLLATHPYLWEYVPAQSVLTPHIGEFHRLVGECEDGLARLSKQRELSLEKGVVLVLKGARTSISSAEGQLWFNSTGNAGMATAGSGDVLTGMITGLMAQGYSPLNAALIGVLYHGKAGDRVAKHRGMNALIAGDVLDAIKIEREN